MFFCINLVFASSDTRVIKENKTEDIIVNMGTKEYVLTNAVIDPTTKGNIYTYVVKDNVPLSFSFANVTMNPSQAVLNNFYYRTVKGKNVKIRCYDTIYSGNKEMYIIPDNVYEVLKATNRLHGCLFIFEFAYKVDGVDEPKHMKFAFKIVPPKEYEMYEDIEIVNDIARRAEENGEILRPVKQK